ncbi:hypothetical protein P7K49_014593 [Saguinus oedipus]|uniref:Uncharacterized protein n=1 Tax=Saguinus oedipus TaxID=9490 RepID=A0ABQ9V6T0_SAGOE|nr:hypothetical protein P7K49_014593 [Saguinus oedipus]
MKKNGQHVASSPILVISQSEIGVPATFRSLARASMKATPLCLQSLSLIPKMQVGSCCLPVGAGTLYMAPKLRGLHSPGYGWLSLSIEGSSKVDINTEDLEDGMSRVTYCPPEPGNYIINKYADQHMPGSPFSVKAVGSLTLRQPQEERWSPGLLLTSLSPPYRNQHPGYDSQVTSPSGKSHEAEIVEAEFSLWTREADAGGLAIAVEGPSKAEISFEDSKDGSCSVTYVVQEPGDYKVSVKFNEEHIPDSPFIVPVASPSGDTHRLTVSSLQELGLKVNQPASFAVSLNEAKGVIDAKVHSPSGALEEYYVTEIYQDTICWFEEGPQAHSMALCSSDKYAVCFIPRENGVYLIDVKFNGTHIPGSTFKIQVGEPGHGGDPSLVSAYGAGLEGSVTGSPDEFIMNMSNAGAGALSVTIDGPSKVKMDCQKCPEGYHVTYTPMAPGSYLISIKYGGPYHIGGSPFKAKVTGEPGAKLLAPAQCLALWPPLSPTHSVLQPIPGALGPLLNTAQLCPCHGLLHQPVSLTEDCPKHIPSHPGSWCSCVLFGHPHCSSQSCLLPGPRAAGGFGPCSNP